MPTRPPERLIHSYGRRRGRPLRHGRAALLGEMLPRLTIPPPAAGDVLDPRALFPGAPASVWLEIGFGGGEHLAHQAEAHREIGFIGAEPYVNGIAGLLTRASAARLGNIRLWPGDIRELLPALPPASLGRVFILFPDPWPKARHHKRRLIQPEFLDELARVMALGAELRFATDDSDYLAWTLERLGAHPAFAEWAICPPQPRPPDAPQTRYETKALVAGRQPVYVCVRRCERAEARAETP
jgi:tRNA (guanine-N7-)-methyltransferase